MNVWKIHAVRIRFVSTLPEAMTVSADVDSLEIHSRCVHQFKLMLNATTQIVASAVNQLPARLDIDVTAEDV